MRRGSFKILELISFDNNIAQHYYLEKRRIRVIESFKCKETEKIWNRVFSKKFPVEIHKIARRKLIAISISDTIQDLKQPPSNQLEKLAGDRKGQFSIRINKQWRVCFKWNNGNALDIEIVDYH